MVPYRLVFGYRICIDKDCPENNHVGLRISLGVGGGPQAKRSTHYFILEKSIASIVSDTPFTRFYNTGMLRSEFKLWLVFVLKF